MDQAIYGNQYYQPAGYQQPVYGYPAQPTQPYVTKPTLTQEEINRLRSKGELWSIALTQDEVLRCKCNHRDHNGQITLVDAGNGLVRCTICDAQFPIDTVPQEAVEEAVQRVQDILQQIKTYWLNAPKEVNVEFMPIIALLGKIPNIYQVALDSFGRYNAGTSVVPNYNGGLTSPFNVLDSFMMTGTVPGTPVYGAYGPVGYQQPVYQQPVAQPAPVYYNQPQVQQPVAAPVYNGVPSANPFGVESAPVNYAFPVQQPVAQPAPVAQQPAAPVAAPAPMGAPVQQPAAPVAPQAPAVPTPPPAPETTAVQETFTI